MLRNSNTALMQNKQIQSYQKSEILGLGPNQLIIKVYDFVILQCKKGDIDKASKGLVELISSLNFEHEEIALGLFRLYQYCMDQAKQSKFDEVVSIMQSLRTSWIEAAGLKSGGATVKT